MKRFKGQAIAEYGLAASLVAIAGLVALMYMMSTINGGLPGWLDNIFGGGSGGSSSGIVASAASGKSPGTGLPPATVPPGTGSGKGGIIPPPAKGQEQLCFKGGYCVNVPEAMATDVETLSADGSESTRSLAQVFEQLAEQIAEEEGRDSEIYQRIKRLAELGYEMGDDQRQLENLCANGASDCTKNAQDVVANFNNMVAANSEFILQFYGSDYINNAEAMGMDGTYEPKPYLSSLEEVFDRYNFPPELRKVIEISKSNISSVAQGYQANATENPNTYYLTELDPAEWATGDNQFTIVMDGAKITYFNSENICATGADKSCIRDD